MAELSEILCVEVVYVEDGQTTIVWESLLDYLRNPEPGSYLLRDHRHRTTNRTDGAAPETEVFTRVRWGTSFEPT